jgi:hypothetical protein
MSSFPRSYEIAYQHLLNHGAYGHSARGRQRVAEALRELRRAGWGREVVQGAREQLLMCSHGRMPLKTGNQKRADARGEVRFR